MQMEQRNETDGRESIQFKLWGKKKKKIVYEIRFDEIFKIEDHYLDAITMVRIIL